MQPIPRSLLMAGQRYLTMLDQLKSLYTAMDQDYAAVADRYGFHCTGCADNCCLTRFYHHTLAEVLYLVEGLGTLPPAARLDLIRRAGTVENEIAEADRRGGRIRRMCPLNQDGRCRLYAYRPMICRLHGIPHELHRPGGEVTRNPGCDAFFNQCRQHGQNAYIRFDRTPFYRKMAMLEKELRSRTGYTAKIKFTVAQILMMVTEPAHEID